MTEKLLKRQAVALERIAKALEILTAPTVIVETVEEPEDPLTLERVCGNCGTLSKVTQAIPFCQYCGAAVTIWPDRPAPPLSREHYNEHTHPTGREEPIETGGPLPTYGEHVLKAK